MLRELAHPVDHPGSFRRRLRRLKRDFRAHGRGGWYKRLYRVSAAVRAVAIASGISRLKLPLTTLLKLLSPKASNGPAKPKDP